MGTAARIKLFDFTDSDEWTLAGDAAVADDALSLTDPEFEVPWGVKYWSGLPDFDENGDALLGEGTLYYAMDGESSPVQLDFGDGIFMFWAKHGSLGITDLFHQYLRHDVLAAEQMTTELAPLDGDVIAGRIKNSDGGLKLDDRELGDDWADDAWREIAVRMVGDDVRITFGAYRKIEHTGVDRTTSGTVGLKQDGSSEAWTLGGGDGGTHAAPTVYYRRQGAAELKEANAWTVPTGIVSLDRLLVIGDLSGSAGEYGCTLQYKLKHSGVWGDWTSVGDDGDMSGAVISARDLLLVRLNDGDGVGLDNVTDMEGVPSVDYIALTYTIHAPTWTEDDAMKAVLANIKSVLDADETLLAYDGWSGSHITVAEIYALFQKCGVFIVPDSTVESPYDDNPSDASGDVKTADHYIDLYCAWLMEQSSTADMLTGDNHLMDFTDAVMDVIRRATFDSTIQFLEVQEIEYAVRPGGDESRLFANRVRIRVRSLYFEG